MSEESKIVVIEGSRKRDIMSEYQDRPDNSPMAMLAMAVRQGADLDKIAKLMDLQERHEANEARKAFTAALAGFKAAGITVGKDKQVSYTGTAYTHASLGNVCKTIGDELSKHGLSATWKTEQGANSNIKVTCILSHVAGHSESVSLEAGPDDSGKKNRIQQIASTVSYLERYTLLAITGTATADMDDDGAGSESNGAMPLEVLNAHLEKIDAAENKKELQAAYLPALCEASELRDQKAQDMLNQAKNERLAKL